MKIYGVTNLVKLGTKEIGIFMWDFDKVSFEPIVEECRFLSDCFGFDIYLLESSKQSYHLISFDIMSKEEISRIQSYITIESDYLNIDELGCNFYNILRLGNKGSKESPKFIKAFYAKNNKRMKSLGHYLVYRKLCKVPDMPEQLERNLMNTEIDLIMYNSHKNQKVVKIIGNRRKDCSKMSIL